MVPSFCLLFNEVFTSVTLCVAGLKDSRERYIEVTTPPPAVLLALFGIDIGEVELLPLFLRILRDGGSPVFLFVLFVVFCGKVVVLCF